MSVGEVARDRSFPAMRGDQKEQERLPPSYSVFSSLVCLAQPSQIGCPVHLLGAAQRHSRLGAESPWANYHGGKPETRHIFASRRLTGAPMTCIVTGAVVLRLLSSPILSVGIIIIILVNRRTYLHRFM